MRFLKTSLVTVTAALISFGAIADEPVDSRNDHGLHEYLQRHPEEFDPLIHGYLMRHPEVLGEMIQRLQDTVGAAGFAQHSAELIHDARDPVGGNPKGDVTIVEFYDAQCGICKAFQPTFDKLLAADKNIRVVYKEMPILGPASIHAAEASLAAIKQGKFEPLHAALMHFKGQLTDTKVFEMAAGVGLDVAKLKIDMAAPEIEEALNRTTVLTGSLKIDGTPTLYIGNHLVTGGPDLEKLTQIVAQVRRDNTPMTVGMVAK